MKKQKRKHSPVLLTMAIVLAVATLISGSTFAWFQSQEKVTNHLETDQFANGDVSLKEIWDAEDGKDWQPGEELNKDVSVVNTGSVEALARVSFEEVLLKLIDDQTQTDKDKTKWGAWSDGQPDRELVDSVYDGDLLKVPHLFNPGAYGGPSSLWYELSPGTSDIQLGTVTFLPSAPDGVFFRYLKTVVGDQTIVNVVGFAPIDGIPTSVTASEPNPEYDPSDFNGKFQRVDFSLEVIKNEASPQKPDVTVTFNGFEQYTYNRTAVDWTLEPQTVDAFTIETDLMPEQLSTYAQTDKALRGYSDYGRVIELIFTADVYILGDVDDPARRVITALGPTQDNKWVYNPEDGWFYYIGLLKPGSETTGLLDAVYLDRAAESDYSELRFNLSPKMEAIQNIPQAFVALWSNGTLPTGKLERIYDHFKWNIMPLYAEDPASVA